MHKTGWKEKQDDALQNTWSYPSTPLRISKAPAAILHPCLGAAFEEKDKPTGASPGKSHRKKQTSGKHNSEIYTYLGLVSKTVRRKRQEVE